MADKISPPNKPVSKKDGFSEPNHTTVTTPKPTFGVYFGDTTMEPTGDEKASIFGKQ